MNDLNSIDKGLKHVGDVVGCADENALGEIEGEVEIVVGKVFCLVLVQKFK